MLLTAALVASGWTMVWSAVSSGGGGWAQILWFTVMAGLAALTTLVVIFLYRNRRRQISVLAANFLLLAGVFGFAVYVCWIEGKLAPFAPPVIALALLTNYLAFRGVMHDELLVKSADRIR